MYTYMNIHKRDTHVLILLSIIALVTKEAMFAKQPQGAN